MIDKLDKFTDKFLNLGSPAVNNVLFSILGLAIVYFLISFIIIIGG